MRRSGRARISPSAGVFLHLLYIYACTTVTTCIDYGVPIEIKLWDTGRTPSAHMVDVTNEFGLKVLAEHNFLNDNNIAFSPYGLMGIMVALYEGVDGESSYQIQRGMQLPWNRNIMRIGFRDIHRTLKTYFVPEEGFLAGLALNNENVTFNDSYKKILRFYGFDLENDQLPTHTPQANNTNMTTTAAPIMNSDGSPIESTTVAMTTENKPAQNTSSTSTREETTTNPNAETISDVDIRKPTDLTTLSPSSAPNTERTTISSTVTTGEATTESTVQTIIASSTTPNTPLPSTAPNTLASSTPPLTSTVTNTPSASTATNAPVTSTMSFIPSTETTVIITPAPSSIPNDGETVAQQTSQATSALTEELTANTEQDNPSTLDMTSSTENSASEPSTITSTMTTSNSETESVMPTSMAETQQTEQATTTNIEMSIATESTTTNGSTLETLQRRKKSIVDFIFTNPPYVEDYLLYRSYDIGPELPGFDDKMFLANGLKSVHVTYMHYDTVLEHAYLPHLEASALRLPLDSDRYYLLVVLPARGGVAELGRLLGRMARESDLSDVYAALRPRRVRAVVPSFTVKGHVTLTTDLQKLGIRHVFEPRQRDFTLMTRQSGVYVRSIEQAVSVAIRKYRPDDQKKNRYVTNREPVTFSATYPFLYFVMDASIHVSLMAGKMVDPLNSRIL